MLLLTIVLQQTEALCGVVSKGSWLVREQKDFNANWSKYSF
jgi:hypothetical protein